MHENSKLRTWPWGERVVYRNCFCHSEQFLFSSCYAQRRASDKELPVSYVNIVNIYVNDLIFVVDPYEFLKRLES